MKQNTTYTLSTNKKTENCPS